MQHKTKTGSELPQKIVLDPMPESEAIRHQGTLSKSSLYGTGWRPVFVAVTDSTFYVARSQHEANCIDFVPLHETTDIECPEPVLECGAKFHLLSIATIQGGHNVGRTYQFRSEKQGVIEEWYSRLSEIAQAAKSDYAERTRLTPLQKLMKEAKAMHDGDRFQQFFGAVIMLSFSVSLVQSEMTPAEPSDEDFVFQILDYCFTALFTIELIVTFVGHCGLIFFKV
jgi:hypothetical protein